MRRRPSVHVARKDRPLARGDRNPRHSGGLGVERQVIPNRVASLQATKRQPQCWRRQLFGGRPAENIQTQRKAQRDIRGLSPPLDSKRGGQSQRHERNCAEKPYQTNGTDTKSFNVNTVGEFWAFVFRSGHSFGHSPVGPGGHHAFAADLPCRRRWWSGIPPDPPAAGRLRRALGASRLRPCSARGSPA
jgi:hypothetical protein